MMTPDTRSGNPHLARLTRSAGFPPLGATLLAALGVGAALALIPAARVIAIPLACLGAGLLPVLVAAIAARLTARDVASEEYQLVRLTELRPAQIVGGYIAAMLVHFRVSLALVLALIPAASIALLEWMPLVTYNSDGGPQPTEADIVRVSLVYVMVMVGLWLNALPGAALGVWLALWWRKSNLTGDAAAVIMIALAAITTLAMMVVAPALPGSAAWQTGCAAGMVIVPLALTAAAYTLALRHV